VLTGQAVNLTGREIDVMVSIKGAGHVHLGPYTGDGITATPSNVDLGPVLVIPGTRVDLIVSTPAAGKHKLSVPCFLPGS
jgi:hypothetical protein